MRAILPLTEMEPFRSWLPSDSAASQKLVAGLELESCVSQDAVVRSMLQLSVDFPNLRSICVFGHASLLRPHAMPSLEAQTFLHLTELCLQGFGCSTYDLQCLLSLLDSSLFCMDAHYHVDCVLLPTSLTGLSITGCGLINSGTQQNLLDLACLSEIILSFDGAEQEPQAWRLVLPRLPCGVRNLTLPVSAAMQQVIDWTNLSECRSLRHVTLKCLPCHGSSLDTSLRSLPKLTVVADMINLKACDDPQDRLPHGQGSRTISISDIPAWRNDRYFPELHQM